MAKLIEPAMETSTHLPMQVTAISASANGHAPPAGQIDASPSAPPLTPGPDAVTANSSSADTLASLDKKLGLLRFGESTISRVELSKLGAKIAGQDISPANTNFKKPYQDFLDALSIDPAKVLARDISADPADSSKVTTFIFELACLRSENAPRLMATDKSATPGSPTDRFARLADAAQKIDIHPADVPLPPWVNKNLSRFGVGMQAYGIYSGMRGIRDAVDAGEWIEAGINAGGIASEGASLIIERGLVKVGTTMLASGGTVFNGFSGTSMGKTLSRGAGLFASVITLPFDIYGAVSSFNAAAGKQGKAAQDDYVSGGINVASAILSLSLGAAALAGFGSIAGPVGLIAAAVLIVGAEIYRAARVVDDIDDYVELDLGERIRAGWLAFVREDQDKDVMDRFKINKTLSDYTTQLELSAKNLLEGPYKDELEYIVNGGFDVTLKTIKIWHYQWDENAGEEPYKLDTEPAIVETDDIILARDGLPSNLKGSVNGSPGENKGILWRLGDGNDQIYAPTDKPNIFVYREGVKKLVGGDKNDSFYFETTEAELNRPLQPAQTSVLDGFEGTDTLAFEGSRPRADTLHVGYDVNLQTGKVALRHEDRAKDDILIAELTSIENISTLRKGSNRVTGDDKANQIAANGYDHVDAGPGDDTIAIRGWHARIDGGPGKDRYYIADTNAEVSIIEDGEQASVIEFGWPMERIQSWKLIDTSLVIRSLRDTDGKLPQHVLTVENIYEQVDGERRVKNNRLQFRTQDGYQLVPTLPAQLPDSLDYDVECEATGGSPAPAPYITNSGTVVVAKRDSPHYFVSRNGRRVDFIAETNTPETSVAVYLDYKDEEIFDIKVNYNVEAKMGVSGYTFLTYSNFNIWIFLPSKIVNFTGIIREKQERHTAAYRNSSIQIVGIHSAHDVVLVMKDGKSYRLVPPNIDYREDAANPGYKSRRTRECLKLRHGHYRFLSPVRVKPYLLATTPQKVNFPPPPHKGIYVVHGQASTYDVYPLSNTLFSLSTPGAIAQNSNASTWTLFSTELTETVTRNEIKLTSEKLQIGSAVIQLPSVDHPGPIESISVTTSSGNIYSVELLFEVLQLYLINAQGYASIDALLIDIRAHRQREELAVKIVVEHIGFSPRIDGTVYYNSTGDYWGIDTDLDYRIAPQTLFIEPN
ncbi:hypothetical protein PS838_05849 [Pseudomonas fluorescens]|nr:hypothetical protein PS838_05849 [Pseudomonas fluorescens]